VCCLVVFDGLRELGFDVGVDSLENTRVGRVCIPYLRENGDGLGERRSGGGDGGGIG